MIKRTLIIVVLGIVFSYTLVYLVENWTDFQQVWIQSDMDVGTAGVSQTVIVNEPTINDDEEVVLNDLSDKNKESEIEVESIASAAVLTPNAELTSPAVVVSDSLTPLIQLSLIHI